MWYNLKKGGEKMNMNVIADEKALEAIKAAVDNRQADAPENIRIFVAGIGWSGPSFGLALDEQKENDLIDDSKAVKFVMEDDLFNNFGDIKIEFMGTGFKVSPSKEENNGGCDSCGGSCS